MVTMLYRDPLSLLLTKILYSLTDTSPSLQPLPHLAPFLRPSALGPSSPQISLQSRPFSPPHFIGTVHSAPSGF